MEESKQIIKAAITSSPVSMTVNQLKRDFYNLVGYEIPYQRAGFKTLDEYLRSLTDIIVIIGRGLNAEVRGFVSEKSAHVADMVSRQKINTKTRWERTKRNYFLQEQTEEKRSSGKNPFIVQQEHRNERYDENALTNLTQDFQIKLGTKKQVGAANQDIDAKALSMQEECKTIIKAAITSSPVMMTVSQLNRDFKSLAGYEIPYRESGFRNLNEYLLSLKDMLVLIGQGPHAQVKLILSKKSAHVAEMVSRQKTNTKSRRGSVTRNSHVFNPKVNRQTRHVEYSSPPNVHMQQKLVDEIREETEEWFDNDEFEEGYNKESNNFNEADNLYPPGDDSQSGVLRNSQGDIVDCNYKIPYDIQEKFKLLINDHPNGIWCAQFISLYEAKFNTTFKYSTYGYTSIIHMCCELPYIFQFKQANHGDYKVYDMHYRIPKEEISVLKDTQNIEKKLTVKEILAPPLLLDTEILESLRASVTFPSDVVQLNSEIPKQKTNFKVGDKIGVQVAEIYDPSKFWFTLCHYENELNELMNDMQTFYAGNYIKYEVPKYGLQEGMYVAVIFMNEYHRALIVNMLRHTNDTIKVFFIDYGTVSPVYMKNICFLHKQFSGLPAQCIRGSLHKLKPPSIDMPWSRQSASRFLELVYNTPLVALVEDVDSERDCYGLTLVNDLEQQNVNLNEKLRKEGFAVYEQQNENSMELSNNVEALVENIHLYPSFDELEMGRVPSAAEMLSMEQSGISLSVSLPRYYKKIVCTELSSVQSNSDTSTHPERSTECSTKSTKSRISQVMENAVSATCAEELPNMTEPEDSIKKSRGWYDRVGIPQQIPHTKNLPNSTPSQMFEYPNYQPVNPYVQPILQNFASLIINQTNLPNAGNYSGYDPKHSGSNINLNPNTRSFARHSQERSFEYGDSRPPQIYCNNFNMQRNNNKNTKQLIHRREINGKVLHVIMINSEPYVMSLESQMNFIGSICSEMELKKCFQNIPIIEKFNLATNPMLKSELLSNHLVTIYNNHIELVRLLNLSIFISILQCRKIEIQNFEQLLIQLACLKT